jgi:hypothetical protein
MTRGEKGREKWEYTFEEWFYIMQGSKVWCMDDNFLGKHGCPAFSSDFFQQSGCSPIKKNIYKFFLVKMTPNSFYPL